MLILTESFGYMDSTTLMMKRNKNYQKIINKAIIYSRNMAFNINEGRETYNTYIHYGKEEQNDIKDLFKLIRELLLITAMEDYYKTLLNEGFMDTLKNGYDNVKNMALNAVNKTKDWAEDKWEQFISKYCPKIKNAYKFVMQVIQSGVQTAKDLFNLLVQLFTKLADTLREAAKILGCFGENAITSEEENQFNEKSLEASNESINLKQSIGTLEKMLNENEDVQQAPSQEDAFNLVSKAENMSNDEKSFFALLIDYVKSKFNKNEMSIVEAYNEYYNLNEGAVNKFGDFLRKKCASNKVLSVILLNRIDGKKVGFWITLIISLIGAFVLFILRAVEPSSIIIANIYLIVGIIWGIRGMVQLIAKRIVQLRPGETLFQDKRFIISLLLTTGSFFISTYILCKNFLNMTGIIKHNDSLAAIKEFLELNPNPSLEEINEFLKSHPDVIDNSSVISHIIPGLEAADPNVLCDQWSEAMQGVKSTNNEWFGGMQLAAENNPDLLLSTANNLASNIKYPGGTPSFVNDNLAAISAESGMSTDQIMEFMKDRITFKSQVNGQTTWGSLLGSDSEDSIKLYDAIKKVAGDKGVNFDYVNLGAGPARGSSVVTQRIVSLIAKAAPVAATLHPFFAVFDFLGTDDGYIVASLGSEASQKRYYYVSKIEQKTLSEVAEEVEHTDAVLKALLQDTQETKDINNSFNEIDKKAIADVAKKNEKVAKKVKTLMNNLKELSDANDHKVALWYGIPMTDDEVFNLYDKSPKEFEAWRNEKEEKAKENDKNVDTPIFFLNPNSMVGYDLEASDPKMRINPWYFRGLQNKLTVKPLFNKDKNTKEYIANMFKGLIQQGVEYKLKSAGSDFGKDQIVSVDKSGKYSVKNDETKKVPQPSFGNLTPEEICGVANHEMDAYKLTYADNADDIKGKKENGDFETKRRKETIDHDDTDYDNNGEIDKIKNYVKNSIIPVIAYQNTRVYKEIMDYAKSHKEFKKMFVLDKPIDIQEWIKAHHVDDKIIKANQEVEEAKEERPTDTYLNLDMINDNEMWFRRSMSSFSQKVDQTTIGNLARRFVGLFKNTKYDNPEDAKNAEMDLKNQWKDIAAMAHIIWKYKGLKKIWGEEQKAAGYHPIEAIQKQDDQAIDDMNKQKELDRQALEDLNKVKDKVNKAKSEEEKKKLVDDAKKELVNTITHSITQEPDNNDISHDVTSADDTKQTANSTEDKPSNKEDNKEDNKKDNKKGGEDGENKAADLISKYKSDILPKIMNRDGGIYDQIHKDRELRRYFLYPNGKPNEKRLNDKYLMIIIGSQSGDKLRKDIEWSAVKSSIMRSSKKPKRAAISIAEKRTRRIKKLYNIISDHFNNTEEDIKKEGNK